jgi:hypothetical protein
VHSLPTSRDLCQEWTAYAVTGLIWTSSISFRVVAHSSSCMSTAQECRLCAHRDLSRALSAHFKRLSILQRTRVSTVENPCPAGRGGE